MKHKRYRGKYIRKREYLPLWLWMIPASLLVIGLVAVGMILLNRHNARLEYQRLAEAVRQTQATTVQTNAPVETTVPTETTIPTETTEPVETTQAATEPAPLEQYRPLYEQNPEMVGWLRIDGTVIDYPVMHTPEDPEKYLHRNFQGVDSYAGTPFIDADDEAEYNSAIKQFKNKSLYDTGVTPQYGQQLITLVTCTYHVENGRFVEWWPVKKNSTGKNTGAVCCLQRIKCQFRIGKVFLNLDGHLGYANGMDRYVRLY